MNKKPYLPAFAILSIMVHSPFADEGKDSLEISRPSFKVSQEVTQIYNGGGYIKPGGLDRSFMEPTSGSVTFQAKKNQRLGLELMVSATYFAAPFHYDQVQNYTRNVSLSTPKLDASYIFGADPAHPFLKADIGIFNFKYNEYARDLGEYMFRTWSYPGIIVTGGTYGYLGANSATVTGVKLSQSMGIFSHDFLATIETDLTPVYDLNLTYMAKVNLNNVLKIGGGIQLSRLVSADKDEQTMKYFKYNNVWYGDAPAYYKALSQGIQNKLAEGVSAADSTRLNAELAAANLAPLVIDSVNTLDTNGRPQVVPSEMHTMSEKAIKPVFYFSFDPKPLIGSGIFGAKDLVLYGEAAILGVKNYPVFYDKIQQRIPMMIGFNLPCFKILDVLSIEGEYYGSQALPAFRLNQPNATPTPVMNLDSYYPTDWDKDNIKWSIYAEKMLIPGITFSAQVASDHSRSWDWNYFGKTPWEIYTSKSQFYWGVKLVVGI